MRFLSLMFVLMVLSACASQQKVVSHEQFLSNQNSCVVLVHGLWRSAMAMNVIAEDLRANGYLTESVDYPSTRHPVHQLSERYLAPTIERCRARSAGPIHLVSHSMGGILVRDYLQSARLPEGSRVVMLSPPNQGSELSERFGKTWWYQALVGPAGSELSDQPDAYLTQLKPVTEPVGIIAAYRDWSLWPDAWLPQPNDGTVSVASMRLKEMRDFVLVNSGHAMMRYDATTHHQIKAFLENGYFDHHVYSDDQRLEHQTVLSSVSRLAPPEESGI